MPLSGEQTIPAWVARDTPDGREKAKLLRQLVAGARIFLVLGAVAGAGTMTLGALIPWRIGKTIDAVARGDIDVGGLWLECLVLLALITGGAALGTLQEWCDTNARLEATLRTVILVHSKAVFLAGRGRRDFGGVVNLGMGDVTPVGVGVAALSRGVGGIFAVMVVALILMASAWQLCLIVVLGTVILLRVNDRLLGPYRVAEVEVRTHMSTLTALALDCTSGLRVIKGLGATERFRQAYRHASQDVQVAGYRMARAQGIAAGGRTLLSGLLGIVAVVVAAELVLSGTATTGELVAAYGYVVFLTTPVRWLLTTNQLWSGAKVCAARVEGFLDAEPTMEDAAGFDVAHFVDASEGYTVLTSVDHTDWNDFVGQLGSRSPNPQEVLLVPSDDYLFSGRLRTVVDPALQASASAMRGALFSSALDDVVQSLESGLDHEVAAGALDFSGGEQQRMRLARALLTDPAILVLVEPTNALDSPTAVEVVRRLRRHRVGRTTVVLTDDPLHLIAADKVVLLAGNRVVAEGSHGQLLERPDYRAVFHRGGDE